jgi:hypothetical protein
MPGSLTILPKQLRTVKQHLLGNLLGLFVELRGGIRVTWRLGC